MGQVNRYRLSPSWDKHRSEMIIQRIRAMGLDRTEEVLESADVNTPPKSMLVSLMLKRKHWTLKELADKLEMTQDMVMNSIEWLRARGYKVRYEEKESTYKIHTKPEVESNVSVSPISPASILRIGLCGDTHLSSKYAREDLLLRTYETFKKEGITEVLHTGNLMDGYKEGINSNEVVRHTLEGQVSYAIDNYPSIEGITTYFISTDCHSGWFGKTIGIDVGKYVEMRFREEGRFDMVHLGYLIADREYKNRGKGRAICYTPHAP